MVETEVSGSTGSPLTALPGLKVDGENGTPRPVRSAMNASKSTPPSGESVSDEQLPDDFEQLLVEEADVCRRLLNDTLRQNVGLRTVAVRIRETRARLAHLERQLPVTQSLNQSAAGLNPDAAEGGRSNSET